MNTPDHQPIAHLDAEDNAILATMVPEGAVPGTPPGFGIVADDEPDEGAADAAAAAQAAAAQAALAAAPAAAPVAAPVAAPAAAPAATASATAAPATAPATAPAAQGDVRGALRAARRNEQRLADQLKAATEALEELRGKTGDTGKQPGADEYTDEELRDLEENFPRQHAMVMRNRELAAQLAAAQATAKPASQGNADWEPPPVDPRVQMVIDDVPQLLAWQQNQADQDKFNLAAQFDTSLLAHPVWGKKPPVERFNEAVRQTLEHLKATGQATGTTDPAAAAAAAIAATRTQQPAAIHDFRGGGPASGMTLDFNRMDDAAILASLDPDGS